MAVNGLWTSFHAPEVFYMRYVLATTALTTALAIASASGQAPRPEVEHTAAFGRLYGVVRHFYPSDAAAGLDWNRFATHGVRLSRGARNATELETALRSLFAPLGPGIEIGAKLSPAPSPGSPDSTLIAWRYLGPGISGQAMAGPYRAKRTHRALAVTAGDGFATMMQTVPAVGLRGKSIRLRGMVRATSADAMGAAALWLRVDRPGNQIGFFDNMGNRPIREPEWREYVIEGKVADDAANVAFGAMALGPVTADFETIGLDVRDATGAWTAVSIADPGFEADASAPGWMRAGTSKTAAITRPTDKAPEGRQFLRIAPPPAAVSKAEIFDTDPPRAGAHVDVELGAGLKARVRLALSESEASGGANAPALDALRKALAAVQAASDLPDIDTRLADVVVAWNVFRHFYPYWTEVRVDWDAQLRPLLALAYAAGTRDAHRNALLQLVAAVHDGHGGVGDMQRKRGQLVLPVLFGLSEGRLVIAASAATDAPVGAVVTTIDGVPAERRLDDAMKLASGAPQWKEQRALGELAACQPESIVRLGLDRGAGPQTVGLKCDAKQRPAENRPPPIAELSPGSWYVDLTRARMPQITPVLPQLAAATGVIFDVRGYPTDLGAQILPHLISATESDRWMHVAKIVGPFGQHAGWESVDWNLVPASPHLKGKIVFMTDRRAISYAESVMGYVADRKLGTIVGNTTAGANGNVATFVVPGGFSIAFTGMRVTGHDGTTPHHLAGVKPDVPVTPTLAGLRAGRDEVLERAVSVVRGK
jgi:hypothetical protein